jgi:hypothetical protein
MRVTAKAGTWRDLIVIPDHKGTKGAIRRIAVGRYDEVMTGFQPAAVTVIERFLRSKLQHVHLLAMRT